MVKSAALKVVDSVKNIVKTNSAKNTKTAAAKNTKKFKVVDGKKVPLVTVNNSKNRVKSKTISKNYQNVTKTLNTKYDVNSWPSNAKAVIKEVLKQFQTVAVAHKSNDVTYELQAGNITYNTGTYNLPYGKSKEEPYINTNVETYDSKTEKQYGGYGVITYPKSPYGSMDIHYDLFDKSGKRAEKGKSITIDKTGRKMEYTEVKYKYDKKGKQKEVITKHETYMFDKNKKLTSKIVYSHKNGSKEPTSGIEYYYNKKGQIIGGVKFNCDKKGNPIKGSIKEFKC